MTASPEPIERLARALADVIAEAVGGAGVRAPISDPAISVSIPEAAERLGVSASTVKRLVASGKLQSVLIGDRRLIPVASLESFIGGKTPE